MRKYILLALMISLSGSLLASTEKNNKKKSATTTSVTKATKLIVNANSRKALANEKTGDVCRICCTVSVADPTGGLLGFTACSGGIFTSCETAGDKACGKAARKALEAAMDAL